MPQLSSIGGMMGPRHGGAGGIPNPDYSVDFTVTGALPAWISFARAAGPATYFDNTGTLQVAGTNVPRFTFDPVTLAPMGFLSEGAATNFIRNNTMVGAATGILPATGVPPTNWSVTTNLNGLVATIVAVGAVVGVSYIDIRFAGTTVSTGKCQVFFEATNSITGPNTQGFQNSAFLEIVGGTNANITNMSLDMNMYDASSVFIATIAGANIYSNILTGTLIRMRNRQIVNQATSAFVAPCFTITPTTTSAIDITIRIGMPQMDKGGFYTSVIPTSGATAARVADGAQLIAPVSTLLGGTAYSVVMQTNQAQNSSSGAAIGSFSQEYLGLGYTPGTDLQVTHARTSSTFRLNDLLPDNQSTLNPLSIGVSCGPSLRFLTSNGGTQVGGTVATDTTPIAIGPWFGTSQSKGFPLDGTIKSFKAWIASLTSAQLETVTFPPMTTCWGDSLTAGTGSVYITAGWGYPGFLSSFLGQQPVIAYGYPGQGSSFIADQAVANPYHVNDNIIIWTGRNNITLPASIVSNTQRIVDHLTPGNIRWVVLSVTNDTAEPIGTANYNSIIADNALLASTFSALDHYLDIRTPVVIASGGANDAPDNSWMYQAGLHFNDSAYILIGQLLFWWGCLHAWNGYPLPVLDLNFASGAYTGAGIGQVICVRNSDAWGDDTTGTWTKFSPNVPVITSGGSGKGLQVYESRTNGVRNNTEQGASAGAPGTLPNFHTSTYNPISNGLTLTVVGTGTESGLDYIDLTLAGTPTASQATQPLYLFDAINQIVAASGDRWVSSAFITLQSGSTANLALFNLRIDERNSGGGSLGQNTLDLLSIPAGGTLGLNRYSINRVFSGGAATAFVSSGLYVSVTNGSAVNMTIRVAREQVEKVPAVGGAASSPIATTTAAATRAADVVALGLNWRAGNGINLTAAGTPTQGSTYALAQYIACMDDGTTANYVGIGRRQINDIAATFASAGPVPAVLSVWAQNASGTVNLVDKSADGVLTFNGTPSLTDATPGLPTGFTRLHLGCDANGANQWNGYIAEIQLEVP